MVDYKHPVNPNTLGSRWGDPNRKAFHYGDDYKVGTATIVRAIADGVCVISGQHRLWGFYTQIEHADGRVSSYHQLQRYGRPVQGQEVKQGQQVGRPGLPLNDVKSDTERESNTIWSGAAREDSVGNRVSTGAHLHLGIMAGIGKPWVNPATVIRTSSAATTPAGGDITPIEEEDELDKRQNDLLEYVAANIGPGKGGLVGGSPTHTLLTNLRKTQEEDSKVFRDNIFHKIDAMRVTQLEDSETLRTDIFPKVRQLASRVASIFTKGFAPVDDLSKGGTLEFIDAKVAVAGSIVAEEVAKAIAAGKAIDRATVESLIKQAAGRVPAAK